MTWLALLLSVALMAAPEAVKKEEFRAPNGLRVILEEQHERPVLRLNLIAGWDRADFSGAQADRMLRILSILKRCGAGGLSRAALDRRLADRGIKLGFEGTGDALDWSMLVDSQDQEDAFELLGHLVFRPALAEDPGISGTEMTSGSTPEACFRASLGFPSEQNFWNGLGMEERFSLFRRMVRPEHSVLVIQGDLSLSQARQLVMLHLGTWSPSLEKPLSEPLPLIGECSAPQEGAWVGSAAPSGDAKVCAAHIAVTILLARIFRDETKGDFVFEAFRPGGEVGPLLLGTRSGPNPEKRIKAFLEGCCNRGFTSEDLDFARRVWEAERAVLTLHPEDQLFATAYAALKGDPGPYFMDLRLEDVNAALRARLAPQALRWLVKAELSSK